MAEIVEVLRTAPHLKRLMTQVCYGYAVRMPDEAGDRPRLDLFEPVDRPEDDREIWAPSGGGRHGYLAADGDHLDAAARHVQTSVTYMNHLLA